MRGKNTPKTIETRDNFICRIARAAAVITGIGSTQCFAADGADVATSALEFGGSYAKLIWEVQKSTGSSNVTGNTYVDLADRVKNQIEIGRASSSLIQGTFNVIGTTLIYAASKDPEPLSAGIAGVAAWGAKKTGDALAGLVADQVQTQAMGILATGLQNAQLTPARLQAMTPLELRDQVADLQIGGQTIRDLLKDYPKALEMLQANAVDVARRIGVEALAQSKGNAGDIAEIREELVDDRKHVDDYQASVDSHLSKLETGMADLQSATEESSQKLEALRNSVAGQSRAVNALAQISYSGWSTAQKLQAVESGLIPDLAPDQKRALSDSLRADLAQEQRIATVTTIAADFGSISAIAQNIGLPPDAVKGVRAAQTLASGVAQFATGNYLGAIASVTSLVGLGAPDAAEQRQAALMGYLQGEFSKINQRLDRVIELQVQTIKAISALAEEQRSFRIEVIGQLDRIETDVLRNEQILQAILLSQWTECYSLINGTPLNGQYEIPHRELLLKVIEDINTPSYASKCYATITSFLDAWVKPANWSAQIISADHFPAETIAHNAELQKQWNAYQYERIASFETARDFVEQTPEASEPPAKLLARIAQPVAAVNYAHQLHTGLADKNVAERFSSFRCTDHDVLSESLRDLLCFGRVPGDAAPPVPGRLASLLNAALIGPQVTRIIDTGITLASLSNLAERRLDGSFVFAPTDLINLAKVGMTKFLQKAVEEHKGAILLSKLQWLSEASVIQQSITYGDYTAELAEKELYDPTTRSLRTDPKQLSALQTKALVALRTNPVLARNVVLLAMRHAIADGVGGEEAADKVLYEQTYYNLALSNLLGAPCDGSPQPFAKLADLFPNWKFEHRVTQEENAKPALKGCPLETVEDPTNAKPVPGFGSGIAVPIADFYALVPTPMALSTGNFEQSDSLRLALAYRDRLSQALIDQEVVSLLQNSVPGEDVNSVAFNLLNSAWGWTVRKKSQ